LIYEYYVLLMVSASLNGKSLIVFIWLPILFYRTGF